METSEELVKKLIYLGSHTDIEFADGSKGKADFQSLFAFADFFASIYGLGRNSSLTSFVEMINNEDPVILAGMYFAAVDRLRKMYGTDKNEDSSMGRAVNDHVGMNGNKRPKFKFDRNANQDNQLTLMQFLRDFGATPAQIEEAKAKLNSGKIKVSDDDYSWITPESISQKDFDLKGALAKLRKDYDNSFNVKVSMSTLLNRK